MAKDPAFLFYYQDFLVGTQLMSAEEVGLYIRILCHLADKGKLSEKHMKNICNGYEFTDSLKEKLSTDENGFYFNKRLQEEVEKRRNYTESRRLNRLNEKGKNKKTYETHMKNICVSYVPHMENENVIEDIDTKNKEPSFISNNDTQNKVNNKFIIIKKRYAENVLMSEPEYKQLVDKFGKFYTEKAILILDNYKGSNGKKYKSDYRAILSWVMDEVKKRHPVSALQTGEKEEKTNRQGIAAVAGLLKTNKII